MTYAIVMVACFIAAFGRWLCGGMPVERSESRECPAYGACNATRSCRKSCNGVGILGGRLTIKRRPDVYTATG
uniref:Uncharacterized protein n=1 Tax=viral metagenome TaxID=1070528 RepID=A0A6H1ZZK8_9ZZZZ